MTVSNPVIYVFFGLIATGKSTLARKWAARYGLEYYNSDLARKELAGIGMTQGSKSGFESGIYTADFTQRTYQALLQHAQGALRKGKSVVLDASYSAREKRREVVGLATRLQADCWFILCQCPEPEMRRRMEKRAADPEAVSEGRWEIYLQQKKKFEYPDELGDDLIILNTISEPDHLLDVLEDEIQRRKRAK